MRLEVLDIWIKQLILESESEIWQKLKSEITVGFQNSYQINWKLPKDAHGKLSTYILFLKKLSMFQCTFFRIIYCDSTVTAVPSMNRISALSLFIFFRNAGITYDWNFRSYFDKTRYTSSHLPNSGNDSSVMKTLNVYLL